MKFKLAKDIESAQIQVGYNLVQVGPDGISVGDDSLEELSSWDAALIDALQSSPSFESVQEAAGDVIAQVADASDSELAAIATFDGRQSVVQAVEEERARRAEESAQAAAEPAPEPPAPPPEEVSDAG